MPEHLAPDTPQQNQAELAVLGIQSIQQVIATSIQQLQAKQLCAAAWSFSRWLRMIFRQKTQQGVAKLQKTSTKLGATIQSQSKRLLTPNIGWANCAAA